MKKPIGFGALMAVVLGLIFSGQPSSGPAFSAAAVQCFPVAAPAGMPKTMRPMLQSQPSFEEYRTTMQTFVKPALKAAEHCLNVTCNAAAQKSLRGALKQYLAKRRAVTAGLFFTGGFDGLDLADRVFSSTEDDELTGALTKLHDAGMLDIASYKEEKEALALIVRKPPAAFRPCTHATPIVQASAAGLVR